MICIYKIIELYLWYRFFKRSHRTSCIWAQLSWNVPSISTEFYLYLLNEVELSPKIRIKYRNHWKGYVSFQLSGQIGLIWAVQWNLDLRKPDLRKNLDLRKIVGTTDFLVHKLFDLRKIFLGLIFDLRKKNFWKC